MATWHDYARFDVFCDCDVFVEDGHYLFVENNAFDYAGNYACHDYQQGRNLDGTMFYLAGEYSGASNDYIMSLEKASWNVARDVVLRELHEVLKHESVLDKERDEDYANVPIIEDAIFCLGNHLEKDGKFVYC